MLSLTRRHFLAGSAAVFAVGPLAACAGRFAAANPIVFVHGNGDTAALWHTSFWRWESNGFDTDRLFAIDFPHPLARSNDAVYQAGRSSTMDQREQLAGFVAEVKFRTGADRVVLVGSSRGGNAIRNYVKNGGGDRHVSHAILCGTPNHGVLVSDRALPGSEFNGAAAFLKQLNAGPNEVVPGVAWATTRSDNADKFAQPDGAALGMRGTPTGVTAEGPALKGAKDIVLAGLDHREVAFHPKAFAAIWDFVMGSAPATTGIAPVAAPLLNGKVNTAGNLPINGAAVEVYETDPATGARRRQVHRQTTGADGMWGPFIGSPTATYEFVIAAPGQPVTHIYRSPFPRGSQIIHLRPGALTDRDRAAASSITLSRPRGYFGAARGDIVTFDGQPGGNVPPGIPVNSTSTLLVPAGTAQKSVVCRFNDETIAVQSWPVAQNRVVIAELHY